MAPRPVVVADWALVVDVEATTAFYASRPPIQCSCSACRNFVAAYPELERPIREFFDTLGVDPTKEAGEVMELGSTERGVTYMGAMAVHATIEHEPPGFRRLVNGVTHIHPSTFAEGIQIGFVLQDDLVQMSIGEDDSECTIAAQFTIGHVPWVLDEAPPT